MKYEKSAACVDIILLFLSFGGIVDIRLVRRSFSCIPGKTWQVVPICGNMELSTYCKIVFGNIHLNFRWLFDMIIFEFAVICEYFLFVLMNIWGMVVFLINAHVCLFSRLFLHEEYLLSTVLCLLPYLK